MAYDRYARGGDNPWRMDIDTLAMGPQRPSAGPTKPPGAKKIYDKPIGPTVAEGAARKLYAAPIGPTVGEGAGRKIYDEAIGPPAPTAVPPAPVVPAAVPNGPPVAAGPANPMTGLLALAPWLQMFNRGQA